LKIPGYSDYLHPYDENHLIGIGKETTEAETGDFSWYQGVKISIFDVSDVEHPKEVSKLEIGDRGTDSPVLRDSEIEAPILQYSGITKPFFSINPETS
jgi:uncharacterized secreted protein with C-terminal beta-propeller domain